MTQEPTLYTYKKNDQIHVGDWVWCDRRITYVTSICPEEGSFTVAGSTVSWFLPSQAGRQTVVRPLGRRQLLDGTVLSVGMRLCWEVGRNPTRRDGCRYLYNFAGFTDRGATGRWVSAEIITIQEQAVIAQVAGSPAPWVFSALSKPPEVLNTYGYLCLDTSHEFGAPQAQDGPLPCTCSTTELWGSFSPSCPYHKK